MIAEQKVYQDENALLDDFVTQLEQQLTAAINERGKAYLVVSGGSTPVPLFHRLSKLVLPWNQVTVLLADDRWVPTHDQDSNERLVREHLLQNNAQEAVFCSFAGDHFDIFDDAKRVDRALQELPLFDVVILGMGNDGHTASLFPCSAELQEGLHGTRAALAITPTTAPHQRISMSRARLLKTRQLYLHIKGESKAKVLAEVDAAGITDALPISYFLHQSDVPMQVLLANG